MGSDGSDALCAFGFDFNIPTAAQIVGLEATIERSENDAADNITDDLVALITQLTIQTAGSAWPLNAVTIGINKADTATEWGDAGTPTTDATLTYGGASDLWGAILTPAIVNRESFGFCVIADGANAGAIARVDHMTLKVYYILNGSNA